MRIKIEIQGLRESIEENKNKIQELENFDETMEKIIGEAVNQAKELCPVDTGALRSTIRAKRKSKDTWVIFAGNDEIDYASENEYGWYGIAGKVGTANNPKFYKGGYRPFLRPAMWNMNREFKKYIKRILFSTY